MSRARTSRSNTAGPEGHYDQLPALVAEFVRLQAAVIVPAGNVVALLPVQQPTKFALVISIAYILMAARSPIPRLADIVEAVEHIRTVTAGGVYQHCGSRHLKRYLAEFGFRYNQRALGVNDPVRTEAALRGIVGKRLTYRVSLGVGG